MISGNENDFNRNRLTHSLEVSSIAKNIYLKIKEDVNKYKKYEQYRKSYLFDQNNVLETASLLETVSLLHDIGNPPFGHAGEVALNCKMHYHGGFEGNAQGLHILTRGVKYFPMEQFDLTKRALLGILKYPVSYSKLVKRNYPSIMSQNRKINHEDWKPPKCYYDPEEEIINMILEKCSRKKVFMKHSNPTDTADGETTYKTFDCSIMNIADDITNAIHDLEDVIYLKLIGKEEFKTKSKGLVNEFGKQFNDVLKKRKSNNIVTLIGNLFKKNTNKSAISDLVYLCVRDVYLKKIEELGNSDDIFVYNVDLNKGVEALIEFLKDYVLENVIKSDQVQTIVHGGMLVIMRLFDAYESNPKDLLSKGWYQKYDEADDVFKKRVISNLIAGMTDEYAYRMYSRLYGHNTRNMFEKI